MSDALDRLVENVKSEFGIPLEFDDRGRCALSHDEDYEILLSLRDESRVMAFAMVVSHVNSANPGKLFADLLKHNGQGSVTGPFYFALDGAGGRILVTRQAEMEALDARKLVAILDAMVALHYELSAIVDQAQSVGETIDETIYNAGGRTSEHALHEDRPDSGQPSPGQFV